MITQQLQVSILAAPVAAIDSRSLSQAWYSALRLAHGGVQARAMRPPFARAEVAGARARRERIVEMPFRAGVQPLCRRSARHDLSSCAARREGDDAVHGGTLRRTLAEWIERAFSDPSAQPRRTTLSMGRGSARIVVILQTRGDRAVLLALCRPELRGIVGRALAQARMTLAVRGIGLELRAIGRQACS
jgi:hypothetical protein